MANNEDFNLKNLPIEANDPEISKDDFKFVQADAKIHDQKFETKPTTFLKDCFRRFCKNKSSVVAAIILGFLLVLSVLVPIVGKTNVAHETDGSHTTIKYLEPKLFKSGTGFWDGTKKMVDIPVDPETNAPDAEDYLPSAVSNLVLGDEQYTKSATKHGHGGYVQFGYFSTMPDANEETHTNEYVTFGASSAIEKFDFSYDLSIEKFDTFDIERLASSGEKTNVFPESYVDAESALFLSFAKDSHQYEVALTDYTKVHKIGEGEDAINASAKFDEFYTLKAGELSWSDKEVDNLVVQLRVKNSNNHKNSCTLVKSIVIKSNAGKTIDEKFSAISFTDANKCMYRTSTDAGYWMNYSDTRYSRGTIYLAKAVLCSFTYDTYEAALGNVIIPDFSYSYIQDYINAGYIKVTYKTVKNSEGKNFHAEAIPGIPVCQILNEEKCPLAVPFEASDIHFYDGGQRPKDVSVTVLKYKVDFKLDKMPKFLLGTDQTGRDMFIYVFEGLRTSLLLGIATTAICFIFGLIWGSICGYFGGTVDLVMERFTDILAGIPWVVVMTLTIIHLGSNFLTFALALCLTGWIGTAATTRTQFYRFRGREYVLASRTLGASHGRLIAKHILPNAMGTIITSAVLMVPSVIFSEATISYLGLGFKNLASLGVILSDNQIELTNHPYLLIFPSVIIALLMISFNLFGNGLRDAVNPSLKGEGE